MAPDRLIDVRVPPDRAVGLESVIVAHGLPRPRNLQVARRCEDLVRRAGSVPATIALVPGRGVVVGIDEGELEEIARRDDVVKANLSNLAATLARNQWGATSVSTSIWACARAGVRVFVTGGIGGVHRGFGDTFDISADLTALSREPVAVVCSGVKSTLHVRATREHLETLGVPVVGYGTDTMPMFYVRESGQPVDMRCGSPAEVADFLRWHWRVSGTAVLVGNPVPPRAAFTREEMDAAMEATDRIVQAAGGAAGRDVTPAELTALREATGGRSLEANVALIESNSSLGGEIAAALAGPA